MEYNYSYKRWINDYKKEKQINMKITDIRTVVVGNPWKNWVFVVVETSDGISGIGETTGGLSTMPNKEAVE